MRYIWEQEDIVAGTTFFLPVLNKEAQLVADLAGGGFQVVYHDSNFNLSGSTFNKAWWANYLTTQNAEKRWTPHYGSVASLPQADSDVMIDARKVDATKREAYEASQQAVAKGVGEYLGLGRGSKST